MTSVPQQRIRTLSSILLAFAAPLALAIGVLGFGASPASADPSNAPTAFTGTFSCPDGSGTFVYNAGMSSALTWNLAWLTYDSGTSALLIPTSISVVGGPTFTKGSAPSTVTCSLTIVNPISEPLIVTGNIRNG